SNAAPVVYLLPNYDEYTVGYTERSAILDPAHLGKMDARNNNVMSNIVVLNGQVVGFWKRQLQRNAVVITPRFFTPLGEPEIGAFTAAADHYGAFLGKSVVIASVTI
ncbi:MAG: crosslink repair DNA glycosylase YcaQ family protein, partial [Ktedonobacterales bacterium]